MVKAITTHFLPAKELWNAPAHRRAGWRLWSLLGAAVLALQTGPFWGVPQ